ncbi:hypothetical protein I7I51_04968 [Histoplasma capsulatum]|uniref:Uncharacterized protein n=1 Tax=Ajellomyces capsulatus TaxID=5037 RepID=A0A8A1M2E4_AJECA|nr:hypothetical protein I7I51_04968 [Histoplasma capsulatum]
MQDELKVKISSGEAAKFMEFDYHRRMTTERFSTKGELMTNLLPRVEISRDVTSKPEPNPFWRALTKNYSTGSGHISREIWKCSRTTATRIVGQKFQNKPSLAQQMAPAL